MTRSMTGFSRQDSRSDWGELAIEIRAVNHRFLELSLRMPEELRSLDPEIRRRVGKKIKRGKLDISVKLSTQRLDAGSINVDMQVVEQLVSTGKELSQLLGGEQLKPIDILRWPGVVQEPEKDVSSIQKEAKRLLDLALVNLLENRESEGGRLAQLLLDRNTQVEELVAQVRARMPEVRENIRTKLHSRLAELEVNADEGRLETEIALLLNKADVDEELDRLDGHVVEVRSILSSAEPVGRRLDFLMQEFNREANTLGSKSQDSETTKVAMDLKVLIEQMREQVQNIE